MKRRAFIKTAGLFVPAFPSILHAQVMPSARHAAARLPTAAGGAARTVIEFDGVDDSITTSGVSTSDDTYSIAFWIKFASFTSSWEPIFKASTDQGVWARSSSLCLAVTSGGSHNTSAEVGSTGEWIHLAFVNNAGTWQWYRDGATFGNGTGAGTISNMTLMGTSGSDVLEARMADLAIFSVALSEANVDALHDKTSTPGDLGNLIAWLKLDDIPDGASGDGDTFIDSVAGTYNGTGSDGANNTGLTGRDDTFL